MSPTCSNQRWLWYNCFNHHHNHNMLLAQLLNHRNYVYNSYLCGLWNMFFNSGKQRVYWNILTLTSLNFCRTEADSFIQFKAMVISTGMQAFLLIFELLVCDKLERNRELWVFVFTPLMFMSVISFGICVWALKHERSFEVSEIHICFHVCFQYCIFGSAR